MIRPLAVMLLCWLVAASVRAEPSHAKVAMELVPDHRALLAARERSLANKLEVLVAALPDVQVVGAEVTLADASRRPIDEALSAPHVALVTQTRRPRDERALVVLVRGAAPELSRAHVSVTQTAPAPVENAPERLRQVGPFRVAADSDLALRAVLALLLVTNVVLAFLLLTRLRRERRAL